MRTTITDAGRARLLTHRLDDEIVRETLAGFLHQHLRHIHGAVIEPRDIELALALYVETLNTSLDDAIRLQAAGVRPRGWRA